MSKVWSDFPIYKVEKADFSKYNLFKRFLEIPDCPKQIYYRGEIPAKFLHTLSIVGSRAITTYGKDCLEKIISEISGHPITIISGLAIGTDGIAHKQALKNKLPIIAIPGSGLGEKIIYPKSNKDLALEILNAGGLLLSEYEENFPPAVWTFPARNRLMAAISDKVLLIEAGEKSGTLITARLAMEYNKDVLAIPGSIFSTRSEGTNMLIQEGAFPILSGTDILHHFRINTDKKEKVNTTNLEPSEQKIYSLLDIEKSKDDLIKESNLDPADFLVSLTMLEIKNLIKVNGSNVRRM